ncbi:MAG: sulfotransferase domain-containing protein [Gammaproteobacteria bacterium]|nr:sulfotransferase domain-containing protein [Gammaproteobacteria bacterium]
MNTTIDPKWGQPDPTHDPYTLANFQPRATDVLITTGPKAGTTWMQQILHQLRTGGDDTFSNIDDVVPWLEFPRPELTQAQRQQQLEQMSNPRLFKTHCTYEQTPGADIARIILTFRDPRDCCVSFYHHLRDMTDEAREAHNIPVPSSLEQHVEKWLGFGSWYRNVSSWWPHRNQDNVLLLRYEDLLTDFSANIEKILHFLDWELTDAQKQRATEFASFAWMKQNASRFMMLRQGKPAFKPYGFIRKGQSGDGKAHLTPEMEQAILQKAYDSLSDDCLAFLHLR